MSNKNRTRSAAGDDAGELEQPTPADAPAAVELLQLARTELEHLPSTGVSRALARVCDVLQLVLEQLPPAPAHKS